jgi:FkbM family methyltransferase
MLGNRSLAFILRNAADASNWRALAAMWRRYPAARENALRYFTGRGDYPYAPEIRTPAGIVRPTLWSHHDLLTANEVFCREDYRAQADWRVVVDVGANIGLSTLYFLTEAPAARVVCFEPVPRNTERLRQNLAGREDRYELHEIALARESGTVEFGVEPYGRYGGIGVATQEQIMVPTLAIADALEAVLRIAGLIDLLKIDTEGTERDLIAAIPPEQLARIDAICFEDPGAGSAPVPGFHPTRAAGTLRLERSAGSAT